MSLGKGRKCAETCLDLLNIELVNYYSEQKITPPQAAIDAIGMFHREGYSAKLVYSYLQLRGLLTSSMYQADPKKKLSFITQFPSARYFW
jgi:hypothetical protein